MSFVDSTFIETNFKITVGMVDTLKTRVTELRKTTQKESTMLNEWLEKSDPEQAFVD